MINNQDWIKSTLSHQDTGRVPYNFMFSPPTLEMVETYYGASPIEEKLDFPIRMNAPTSIKPLYADPKVYGESIVDEFGVKWSTSNIDRGSPIGPCINEPNLFQYQFPNAADEYRFEGLGDWCDDNKDHYRVIWIGDLWERASFMRGMEHLLEDLILSPEFVQELLHGITEYILMTMQILFDRFQFEAIALSDDYGAQQSMLMSPVAWRKFIKPNLKKIYGFAKGHDRATFHHSCGNFYPVIGDMIDIGLDILHPIQPEAMDILKLKREFGARLTFCGGIPTQELLPRGTAEQVRAEVKKLKREIGRSGGYILEPGITIQNDVPLDNIVAMIDEAIKGS